MDTLTLLLERPIAFHPPIAKALGGTDEAIYFQQLYYWSNKGSRTDGYIYKTKSEIEEETTLSTKVQDRVRKKLEALGVLETKRLKANGVPTLHYKVNTSQMQSLLESPQRAYSNIPNGHIPLTKTTTETTATTKVVGTTQDLALETINPDEGEKPTYGDPGINILVSTFEQTFDLKLKRVKQQRFAAKRLIDSYGLQSSLGAIRAAGEVRDAQYAPQILSLEDLWDKWDKLVSYYRKKQQEQGKTASKVKIIEE